MNRKNSARSYNILIVEDDRTTASILKLHVESCHYNVLKLVSTGEEAISSATSLKPDLVLMDIKLGGEIDGINAAKKIIDELSIPVVYVTSHNDEELLSRAHESAHSGFINKPVREVDIKTTIKLALSEPNSIDREFLMARLNLTKTESELVLQLLDTPDLIDVAEVTNTAVNTIRTHLRNIYKKTGVTSKTELVLKVMRYQQHLSSHNRPLISQTGRR